MKKLLCIVLTVVLALACVSAAFAWNVYDVDFTNLAEESCINDAGIGSEQLYIRNDWTPIRYADGSIFNPESMIVLDEDEEENVARLMAPQALVSTDSQLNPGDALSFLMKKGPTAGFNGVVYNYGENDKLAVEEEKETNLGSYYFTEYPAKNGDDKASYVMATGYGFTFLKDSDSIIRVFVRCITEGELDVIVYDIDTGIDLTQSYNTFGFIYKAGEADFVINEKLAAKLTFADAATVSECGLSGKYSRTAKIFDGHDNEIASTTTALVAESNANWVDLALAGEGTTMYLYGISYEDNASVPTRVFGDPEPTAAPTAEPTATPDATTAPTAAPTDAPKDKIGDKTGCGSMVAGGAVIVLAAAAIVLKKRED